MKIKRGNFIRWTSKAGVLKGMVRDIDLGLNAAKQVCAWMVVVDVVNEDGEFQSNCYLNATDGYLKQMKVEVL
jgi:hypothetical protein